MAQLRLYTSREDEERIGRIYAYGFKFSDPGNPNRNPKWWALRLALSVSLSQKSPPEESKRSGPHEGQYQLQQVTGLGKTGDEGADLTDAFRALLSIYHGEDLFSSDAGENGEDNQADRRFLEILYAHIHRGLSLMDSVIESGQPVERFLAETLFPFVQERVTTNTDEVLSRLMAQGIRAQLENVRRGPRVDVLRLRLSQADSMERLRRGLDDLAFAMGLAEGQLIATPTNTPMVAALTLPRPATDWDVYDEGHLQGWIRESRGSGLLPIWLGATMEGQPFVFDLRDAPHLLVAGTTGSGKSMCLHTIILSLALSQTASDIHLVLIDAKGAIEFSVYSGLPHLHGNPIIADAQSARNILDTLAEELKARQAALLSGGFTKLEDARRAGKVSLPWLVIVVDELADLLLQSPDLEQQLVRLAQVGRAAGIHLVLGTQRPDAQTFSGLLRANVPSRIALKVAKGSDSQIILDEHGAERLLSKGDSLVRIVGMPLSRVQGVYLPPDAIRRLVTNRGGGS